MPEAQTQGDPWSRVTAVVVTHHSAAVIGQCLAGVARAARIIVVDNESADETLAIAERTAPAADVIRNAVGVGYGNAASQGLARVETEFALLINPDAEFQDDALERLVEEADANPRAGLLSPLLLDDNGAFDRAWDGAFATRTQMPADRSAELEPAGSFCTWLVSGAVNLVRMDAIREAGAFDPCIFLYFEDDDICMRLMAAGWQIVVVPQARARHIGGGSIRAGWDKHWEKFYHLAWSRLYIEAKYVTPGSARARAFVQMLRYGPKAVLYGLSLNRKKAVRDAARFCGSLGYLLRKPASKTTRRARPEGAK